MCDKLPTATARLAEKAYSQFRKDPSHPGLEHHALDDTKRGRHRNGSWAVSITRRYRAIYVPDETGSEQHAPANVWYWIGSHEDYNAFTGSARR